MKFLKERALVLWILVIASAYCRTAWMVSGYWGRALKHDILMSDYPDTMQILNGLHSTPTFHDTLKWWTGSWIAGDQMYFYRPLTSLIWWCEYRVFGDNGAIAFMVVHWTLFAVVIALLFIFLRRLFGMATAGIATTIWVGCFTEPLSLPSLIVSPRFWKNDPECWTSIMILSCMLLLSNYWRTKKLGYGIAGVAAFVLAVGFKEMAYVTPFLACWLWWHERREFPKAKIWPLAAMWLLACCLFAYRIWAIGKTLPANSNGGWRERAFINLVGGRAAAVLNAGDFLPLALVLCGFALALLWRKKWLPGAALLAVGGFLVWRNDAAAEFPFDAALRLMNIWPLRTATIYWDAAFTLFMVWLWQDFLRTRDRTRVFGYGWLFLAYLPLLTAPVGGHTLFFPSTGWAIWLSVPLLNLYQRAEAWVLPKLERPAPLPQAEPKAVA